MRSETRNSKLETRNKFKIRNSNVQNVLNFGHLIFGFVSNFGQLYKIRRASNFLVGGFIWFL